MEEIMSSQGHGNKVGVYVDVSNLTMNGGFGMRYEVLRQFACRGGGYPVRLNAYVSFDDARARTDREYKEGQNRFHTALRDIGYKVILKTVKWYSDDSGSRYAKSNVDLEMGVDALLQSERLDRVLLASGDGDVVRVVHALQGRGCRVEVMAFDNIALELRREADMFVSGYLIPNLLPFKALETPGVWGEISSWVRGMCVSHDKDCGFFRYMVKSHDELWRIDNRDPLSPYANIFFHDSNLPDNVDYFRLPDRNLVFEFQISEGTEPGKLQARNIGCIKALT